MIKLLSVFILLMSSFNMFAQGYAVGDKATDFKLKNVDGKLVSLSDYKEAQGFVVIFTCNHCPFSVAYEDRINALNKKYASQGYPVIAINPNDPAVNADDSFENMILRAKSKSFTFPYLFDDGQTIYPQYGATRTPHVFILDKERIVRYIGAIDDNAFEPENVKVNYVDQVINELLQNKAVSTTMTKAIGCSIKKK